MEEALDALVQALQRYQPRRIILFGSAARGESDADNDLDVLVIKDTPEPFVQRLEAMARLCPPGRPRRHSGLYPRGTPAHGRRWESLYPPLPRRG